uniref:Beta-defensin n=1 Tax=Vombatus ursinus TaxID=29139 RepID=A0A4X2KET9_VOMUR
SNLLFTVLCCFFFKVCFSLLCSAGELKICATCRLGRGKCRRKCKSDETVAGSCKQSMLCCRKRIP